MLGGSSWRIKPLQSTVLVRGQFCWRYKRRFLDAFFISSRVEAVLYADAIHWTIRCNMDTWYNVMQKGGSFVLWIQTCSSALPREKDIQCMVSCCCRNNWVPPCPPWWTIRAVDWTEGQEAGDDNTCLHFSTCFFLLCQSKWRYRRPGDTAEKKYINL